MLDAYIIQEIKKEEAKRREVERRPRLHIERPAPPWPKREERDADSEDEEESEEAVIRIDMTA